MDRLPIDPATGEPLQPSSQPGYYPGFNTLSQQEFWDEATRDTVLTRVVPQDDRKEAFRIPIVNYIDERLYCGRIDGYRYEDMPPDGEAYHLGLEGIEALARHLHGRGFGSLDPLEQDDVLWTLHGDRQPKELEIWKRLPADRFWILLVSDAVDAYYAHPFAWDEVGFGGPAYPRGYFRLESGRPEPWEVEEQRYDWAPPPTSSSGEYKQLGGRHPHRAPAGQEGTH